MAEDQLHALLQKIKEDSTLREKFKAAVDLDAAEALASEAGFAVSKEDWIKYQSAQVHEIDDTQLERVAGGGDTSGDTCKDDTLQRGDCPP